MLPKILKPYHINKSNLIRIGPEKDGGYIVDKRILNKSKVVITLGLNDDWDFEKDYLDKSSNSRIIAYDHTVNEQFWKTRFKNDLISFLLFKKIKFNQIIDIFKYFSYLAFFRGKNEHLIKKVVPKKKKINQVTVNEALKDFQNTLLKIDIEGDEYGVLDQINKNSKKINLLIIEFHNVKKNIKKIKKFLKKSNLKIIHIHANNYGGIDKNGLPRVLEISLLNKKKFKISKNKSNYSYPIGGLDCSNLKRRKDIKLIFNE